MFKKTTNYLKKTAKSVLSSGRLKTLALMLLVGGGIAMAQNSAGDYTAGTTALTTVTEEIAKYVPIVVKLCYAIAGVVAVVGAISVYELKRMNGGADVRIEDHDDCRSMYLPRGSSTGIAIVLRCDQLTSESYSVHIQ